MKDQELSLYRALLDNLQDGICIYNETGDFVYVNNAIVNIRGIPRQQYLTMNVHDLYQTRYINICIFDMVLERQGEVTALQRYSSRGKVVRTRLCTGSPIFDSDGSVKYVAVVLRDLNAYDRMYQKAVEENRFIDSVLSDSVASVEPVAQSPKMKALFTVAKNVAILDSTIVLSGESGTGKEVVAHCIHEHSRRRDQPLVEINCAAFPENLLEAELFGYEKGSFTGALPTGKTGLIEAAHRSTLFLDEINSLPLSLQGKLLRVIEDKSFKPVGSIRTKKVDFRLIAATNVDLEQMVRDGTFRADLFYRLNVVPIRIPPLREHKEDIIPLCLHFLRYFSERYGITKRFSKSVLQAAYHYDWPGNVRELRNFVERLMVMTPPNVSTISNLPAGMLGNDGAPSAPAQPEGRKQVLDRAAVIEALEVCGGHRERTAQYLGISRRTLQYKLREFGLLGDAR